MEKVSPRLDKTPDGIRKPLWDGCINTIPMDLKLCSIDALAVVPPLPVKVKAALDSVIRAALLNLAATPPQQRQEFPLPRWTLKRLVAWVKEKFSIRCCRETLRKGLKALGFSRKKARKLLNKANPKQRAAFLKTLQGLSDDAMHSRCLLVYIDEAHLHLDTDQGYGWSIKGERFWVSSSSPGLAKVSLYGLYLYNVGQVRIFFYNCANQLNTVDVLESLRAEFPDIPIIVIWDRAPYHRAGFVKTMTEILEISIEPLPSYGLDFMPVEHLWQWVTEDLTYPLVTMV